jgi:hypothetical protein
LTDPSNPDDSDAWDRELENPEKNSSVGRFAESLDSGFSARCVRNAIVE